MKVRVKVCGVRSPRDLLTVVDAGVDAVGFVVDVPSSPRSLTLEEAGRLTELTPVFVETVAVTVARGLDHLRKIADVVNPSAIQIHGLKSFNGKLRSVLRGVKLIAAIPATPSAPKLAAEAARFFDAVLIDTPGGGTGRTHDWSISRRVRELISPKPLILAGGLNPANVEEAIRSVRPYAVDVSSGVEAKPGVKDPEKVFEFVRRAAGVEV